MITEIFDIRKEDLSEIAAKCREIWLSGGLVAFPTETVYGLGGNGLNSEASRKIYAAKGRPSDNPLILHVGRYEDIPPLVRHIPEAAEKLMKSFFPGPLTIIMEKAATVPYETSGGLETVAIRMPSHPVAGVLLRKAGVPIAAPSANLSGRPSPTSFRHVEEDMAGRIDAIVNGGDVGIGVESAIIDVTGPVPMILRPGFITKDMLEACIGKVEVDPAITADGIISHRNEAVRPKAPGMKYRHYAPKAPVTVVHGDPMEVVRSINERLTETSAVLTTDARSGCYTRGHVLSLGKEGDAEAIARHLYGALRDCDTLGATEIFSEDFTETDFGGAIMNRLLKAAGGRYFLPEEL